MDGGISEHSWTSEAGGDTRVDSDTSTVGLGLSLPVDGGISVHCGTVEAGGQTGVDGDPSAVGLGRPLAVVEMVRSAAVAGGGDGSVGSHSSIARPGVLTVEGISIWRCLGLGGGFSLRSGEAESQTACENLKDDILVSCGVRRFISSCLPGIVSCC